MQISHFSAPSVPQELYPHLSLAGKLLGFSYLMAKLYLWRWWCYFWQAHTSHSERAEGELAASGLSWFGFAMSKPRGSGWGITRLRGKAGLRNTGGEAGAGARLGQSAGEVCCQCYTCLSPAAPRATALPSPSPPQTPQIPADFQHKWSPERGSLRAQKGGSGVRGQSQGKDAASELLLPNELLLFSAAADKSN